MIGTMLGRNRIIEKVGEGGMGAVYRAEDEHLNRQVAIKVLPASSLGDEAARKRFRKEALTLSKLNHQNIELVYDFDQQEGVSYLVMEYVPGRTVKDMLAAGGTLSAKEISRLVTQLVEGLEAAHALGIAHCDLKPGNLMITPEGQLKILDFGLAKLTRQETEDISTDSSVLPQTTGGTLAYMSPEQLTGDPVDHRTDIYAVGNIIYEMATGRLPFRESLPTAIVNQIVHQPPLPPGRFRADLSVRMEELILKCLEKNPENRYQSAKELLVDLRRTDASEVFGPIGARPPKQAWQPLRVATLIAVASLACIALVRLWFGAVGARTLPEYRTIQVTRSSGGQGQPALSPDGSRIAYTSNESGNRDLYWIDIRGGPSFRLTDSPAADEDPAWFPDGSTIAYTSEREVSRSIWKVGQLGGGATLLIPDAEQPAISSDGKSIAFCQRSPSGYLRIGVAALGDLSQTKIITGDRDGLGDHIHPTWAPGGQSICYGTRHNLWIVPASGGVAKRLTVENEMDSEPEWAPDGKHIYFSSYRGGGTPSLWRISPEGGKPERITTGIGPEGHPNTSRDGKHLAYSTSRTAWETVLLDRTSGKETILWALEGEFITSIAPDSSKIVFPSDRWAPKINLWIQPLRAGQASGSPYLLTDISGDASHPAFSPDGRWISYYRILQDQRHVWIIETTGGQPHQLTAQSSFELHPSWSPDGSKIAFVSQPEGTPQIWYVSVKDGKPAGRPKRLTEGGVQAYFPTWSPDGKTIAFQGIKQGRAELWMVSSDGGTDARQLTHGGDVRRARWDFATGELLASGGWGTTQVTVRRVSPANGTSKPFYPAVSFGAGSEIGLFDVSRDGRTLVFTRRLGASGDIWILEATKGVF